MMIQNSFTAANRFSVALSYDTTRGLTSALVHGLTKIEISNLTRLISESRELIALPTMLFSLLLDSRVSAGNTRAEDCHSEIIEIEEQTGLRTVWNSQECSGKDQKQHQKHPLGPPRYDSLDFDDLTSKLTSISSKLAFNEYTCEVHLPMLDSFDKINRRLLEMRSAGGINSLAAVEAQLRTHNEFMRSSLTGTLFRARYLSKRAQAQIQTVCQAWICTLASRLMFLADIQLDRAKGQRFEHARQCFIESYLRGSETYSTSCHER